jgi:copper homeostasis protein
MDGVVFGTLNDDGRVDVGRTQSLVNLARPLPVTFHRAFDVCATLESLEDVVKTGARRILTSGGAPSVPEGLAVLAELVAAAGERIVIVPGGGINASNLMEVARHTHAREFHSGLSTELPYPRTNHDQFQREVEKLAKLVAALQ